jgi:hypothetical protein
MCQIYLGVRRGYRFLGCNQAGNNAFFLDGEIECSLPIMTTEQGYVRSKFREGRGTDGKLIYKTAHEMLSILKELPLVNLKTGGQQTVGDLID